MKIYGLAEYDLKYYLERHEEDIFHSINDFGELWNVYLVVFGEPPCKELLGKKKDNASQS